MKFAINSEGKRILPFKHGRGICPVCESTVIARCGNKRTHHWAHESLVSCSYTEYEHTHETPWHINWKNHFPSSWQEIILRSPEGEKHISDVRTPHGLTIEFQHSPISAEERISREKFYSSVGRMIWVVDGTTSKDDWERYYKNRLLRTHPDNLPKNVTISENAKLFFSEEWLSSNVVIVYDFLGCEKDDQIPEEKKKLVCIIPDETKTKHFFITIKKELFIALCQTSEIWLWLAWHTRPASYQHQSNIRFAVIPPATKTKLSSARKTYTPTHVYNDLYQDTKREGLAIIHRIKKDLSEGKYIANFNHLLFQNAKSPAASFFLGDTTGLFILGA